PEAMLAPPAFVSELMGLTVYQHIDGALDDILADEPEARERVRVLLREVMTDELAHVGQRRNFLGPLGLRAAHRMVESMYRAFFPELAEPNVVDPDRAGSFDDEPEVDEVRVAGVEHMSILAPSSEFVSDVGSSGPLRIGRQKEGLRLRPAHQRPEGCRIEGSWSQPRDSLGERSPLTVGLLTVVVESECGRSGAAVGRIQHPTR